MAPLWLLLGWAWSGQRPRLPPALRGGWRQDSQGAQASWRHTPGHGSCMGRDVLCTHRPQSQGPWERRVHVLRGEGLGQEGACPGLCPCGGLAPGGNKSSEGGGSLLSFG